MFTKKFEPVQGGSIYNTTAANTVHDMPMNFIPNKGQSKVPSLYYSREANSAIHFNKGEIFFAFVKPAHHNSSFDPKTWYSETKNNSTKDLGLLLSLRFIQANPGVAILAEQEGTTRVNFFTGQEPSQWFTGIPVYHQISYRDLWPGIDMQLKGKKGQIKYEFIAKPGADINNIRLSYAGADGIILDEKGNLQIQSCIGTITDCAPLCYQVINGKQVEVAGEFVLGKTSSNEYIYGFSVSEKYDPSYSLVIDPGLDYSTYLGGTQEDEGRAIAVDSSGYAYISGATFSGDFPTTPGVFQLTKAGAYDAFITKMDTSGSSLVWSTYLGGSGVDMANAMVLDSASNVIVGGMTTSPDFPVTAVPPSPLVNTSPFLTKLNPTGDSLIWSLAYGGDGFDYIFSVALDSDEDVYVAGETTSSNLPVTPGAVQPTISGMNDGYLMKINKDASTIIYCTYLGGSSMDSCKSLIIDAAKNTYVCGVTLSNDFPITAVAYQTLFAGDTCGFISKLNPDATVLIYSTYLGGSIHDQSMSITIDSDNFAYVCGYSNSPDFPTTPGAYQEMLQAFFDVTVSKLNQDGSDLVWATFIGGSTGDDQGLGILLDNESNVYVTGSTNSLDFPISSDAYQSSYAGNTDAFLSKLNTTGSSLLYSTFLGGLNQDIAQSIAMDDLGNVYLTGVTFSENFPVTPGAFQETMPGFMGFSDGFVTKFDFQQQPLSGGVYRLVRYVINTSDDFPDDAQQFDADFFLVPDDRKVIHGTVRFPDGTPAPAAVVKFFKMLDPLDDPETTCDLESIGHAITDDCGQFLLGPLPPDVNVIIKIFFLQNASALGTPIPYIGTATPIDP